MPEDTDSGGRDDAEAKGFSMQASLLIPQPDRRRVLLNAMEFAVLKDGDMSNTKGRRDLCIGIGMTSLFAVIALWQAVDWEKQPIAGKDIFTTFVAAVVLAASCVVAFIEQCKIWRIKKHSSAHSLLMQRLEREFSQLDTKRD